ncbi:MAG: hypothetical protein Q7T58_09985 [Methylotenera sp.]|nr:hypothetical protein [Methylotenera sp.]
MELIELKHKICESFTGSNDELNHVLEIVSQDRSVFPFNEYEHLILNLIALGGLTYNQYCEIRSEYISENPYLWIFEISAPTTFGKFAETYLQGKCSKLKKPSNKLDSNFSKQQYDLWLDGIRIEVKASRVVDKDSSDPLYVKALSRNTKQPFLMNFQQLKPQYCDVFIWVAVFRDEIVVWVMSATEVLNNPKRSKGQHSGNYDNEGQLHITQDNIHLLDQYELKDSNIEVMIKKAANRN